MWDKRLLEKVDSVIGTFSISCNWKTLSDGFEWACSGVYGPNLEGHRAEFWRELVDIRQRWNVPWCAIGDFNVIRFPSERLGCTSFSPVMLEFSYWIDQLNLKELPLAGGAYTWYSGTTPPSMSWIDQAPVSPDWENHFPDVIQKMFSHPISDHCPILVEAGGLRQGKSYFKFKNM